MNKPASHIAALKIWFAGLLLGSFIFILFDFLARTISGRETDMSTVVDSLTMFAIMVVVAGIYSLPSALALLLVLTIQYRFRQSETAFWGTILCATLALTIAPFAVLQDPLLQEDGLFLRMAAAYLAGIWIGVYWVFRGVRFDEPESQGPLEGVQTHP